MSAVVGRRTLILINITDAENPIELAFQSSYGSITSYRWFGDGYILIGFTGGYCIAISTHMKEIGQELFQIRNHRDKVSCISICQSLNRAACVGDNKYVILSPLSTTSLRTNLLTFKHIMMLAQCADTRSHGFERGLSNNLCRRGKSYRKLRVEQ